MSETGSSKKEEMFDAAGEIHPIILGPYSLSAYNVEQTSIKYQPAFLSQKPYCIIGKCVDVSGGSRTGRNGRKTWRLSDVVCLPISESKRVGIAGPISFVATPVGDKPILLTTKVTIQTSPQDLIVEVYTWDLRGNPAPCVPFGWRCRVRYFEKVE